MDHFLHFLFDHCRLIAKLARIVEHRYRRQPKKMTAWQYVLYGHLIGSVPRTVLFGQALKRGDEEWAQLWEPVMWHASRNFAMLNGNFVLCMAALPLFATYFHYLFDFRVHRIYAAPMVNDLFVVNCRRLLVGNPFLLPHFTLLRPLESARSTFALYLNIWRGVHDQIFHLDSLALPFFPGLSKRVRIKASIVALLLECATAVMVMVIATITGVLCLQYLFHPSTGFIFQAYPFIVYFRLAFEGVMTAYGLLVTITFLFWGMACAFLIKFVYECQLKELGAQLQMGLYRAARWQMTPTAYAALLRRYRVLHCAIWRSIYLCKVQLVDNGLLVLVICNASLNVFLVSMFLFYEVDLMEQLVAIFAILVETVICAGGAVLMANFSAALFGSGRYLHRATIFLVGPSRLPDKLKMMSYYEVVHSTSRLCFSIGSLFELRKELFLNYVFLYTGYVFYVSKMVRKNAERERAIEKSVLIR